MSNLSMLENIGPKSEAWLNAVGIATVDDLERLGPDEAWRRAKQAFPDRVTTHLLYALHGALLGVRWTDLPHEVRQRLAEVATSSAPAARSGSASSNGAEWGQR